jgi:hypothetical protein
MTTTANLYGTIRKIGIELNLAHPNFKSLYWFGLYSPDKFDGTPLLFFDLFRYCMWKAKTRGIIPNFEHTTELIMSLMFTILKISGKTRTSVENNNTFANLLQALG